MRFELGLEKPIPRRPYWSALTIGGAYVAGGLIPLSPYMLSAQAGIALAFSLGVTLITLAAFGAIKARFTGASRWRGALQTTLVGGLAAAAAFLIARAIG